MRIPHSLVRSVLCGSLSLPRNLQIRLRGAQPTALNFARPACQMHLLSKSHQRKTLNLAEVSELSTVLEKQYKFDALRSYRTESSLPPRLDVRMLWRLS
jgi:hypothetical protein